jgi:hypothetical protein
MPLGLAVMGGVRESDVRDVCDTGLDFFAVFDFFAVMVLGLTAFDPRPFAGFAGVCCSDAFNSIGDDLLDDLLTSRKY